MKSENDMDADIALKRFIDLTQIPGRSGEERDVADRIVEMLVTAGLDESQIQFDDAHSRTHLKGNCGNLIVTLPGNRSGVRTMLSAHMDTVPICVGSQPVVDQGQVRSSVKTGLGADDRSGCAAILTAAIERIRLGDENFPPAVIAFFIQEEIGLHGARCLDVAKVGQIDRAFNFDGGSPDKIRTGAVGGERINIKLTGTPAHAGVAPEQGASAIVMAAKAIADLDGRGWLGKVVKDEGVGTANVGIINGGDATNVITPEVTLRAEGRSHDAAMRTRIVQEIRDAFTKAAESVMTDSGVKGTIDFDSNVDYESFRLSDDHPSVEAASVAIKRIDRTPTCEVANGGLDANWLFQHGIEAVTLGCGQKNIHTVDERLEIGDFLDACRIASWLITAGA
ncbi:Carboxypeptidase G2 precursor [Planctomycetes bacterium CA13]|uniref:Carboxypeptidase G2 n=1 Tax=Novipirellula herctigrandis TaxID=2527986 RepID=A0A5C5YNU7_9BACT|nr:Carboxypeptidase G2 precursor [Planctomycetes bacterium CA13]